jgi:hypothetical protein
MRYMLCASSAGLHNSEGSYGHTATKKIAVGHRGRFRGEGLILH